ncbi:Glycosyltransferase [Burkholderia singularis]|uniref:Glycosyltransferase n=1 Tax=Burkholderia singularis TaxID=1503053 RepID=A0A238H7K2_9BURK|nr:Glycosyltransferase [Burkholderia singularis]
MAYDGDEFLYCAYRTLLGRDPDQEGASFYLSKLENGADKLQIIDQLCSSPELKNGRRVLPGLEHALRNWHRFHWPIVGKIFGPPDAGRFSGVEQKLHRVENSLTTLSTASAEHLNQLSERLTHAQALLERVQESGDGQAKRFGESLSALSDDTTAQLKQVETRITRTHDWLGQWRDASDLHAQHIDRTLAALSDGTVAHLKQVDARVARAHEMLGQIQNAEEQRAQRVDRALDALSNQTATHWSETNARLVETQTKLEHIQDAESIQTQHFEHCLVKLSDDTVTHLNQVTARLMRTEEMLGQLLEFANLQTQRLDQALAALSGETASHLNQIDTRLARTHTLLEQLQETTRLQEHRLQRVLNGGGPVLGRPNQRFVFNLSTSHHWRARPVGIVRVERELAKHLAAYENVTFVLWDPAAKVLREFDRRHVGSILSERWCDSTDASVVQYHHATLPELDPSGADTYISVGLDWDLSPIHDVAKYLRKYGAKMVGACHDVVPILFPEFSARQEMAQTFQRHFVDMAYTATSIFANSDSSCRDLASFWEAAGVETRFPKISVIPLAVPERSAGLPGLEEREASMLRHILFCGNFVLYVSSLEARKNHRLLVNIWDELYRDRGADCPQLVFVGMKGWGVDDLMEQLESMPMFKEGKVLWLQNVSDALLAHLYANCLFTVFPSMYEGWGLAATESMSFGKACVIANNSALPQAAQGLMPQYHPGDFFGWKNEITRLIDDHAYRLELERKIASQYVTRTWADFSREFCEKLLVNV